MNQRILFGFFIALSLTAVFTNLLSKVAMVRHHEKIHLESFLIPPLIVSVFATNIHKGLLGYTLTGKNLYLVPIRKKSIKIIPNANTLFLNSENKAFKKASFKGLNDDIPGLHHQASASIKNICTNPSDYKNSTLSGEIVLLERNHSAIASTRADSTFHFERSSVETDKRTLMYYAYFTLFIGLAAVLLTLTILAFRNNKKIIAMENQLQLLQECNSSIYDNAPIGYHTSDKQGYFVDINKTLLSWLGYEKNEVLGKLKFSDVLLKQEDAVLVKNLSLFNDSGFLNNVEFNFIKKNGGTIPVIVNAVPLYDAKGKYVESRATILNNTDQKRAAEKINNLNQELEGFTYSVSHDLRAPLRSIDGYSRILQEDYGDNLDEEGRRVLHVIMNNARRMGKLIDDLLDYARLGRKDIQRSTVSMNGLVNNLIREFKIREPDRKIDIQVGELSSAHVDVDMIRQVWFNLIENAFKYTSKKNEAFIHISSFDGGYGEVCYKVKDNGVGFDMKYVAKLFGVFQRLHKMQDFGGTGVGLAIVKRIINRHDGRVWAEGTLEEGAIFYFTIPNNNENT